MTDAILAFVKAEYVSDDTTITPTTPLISSGIVDSFSMVSLKRFLEKSYHVTIPTAAATPEAFDTVVSIVALVERYRTKD